MTQRSVISTNKKAPYSNRESGIELLKIFAMITIVVGHVFGTLHGGGDYSDFRPYSDYIIKANQATANIQSLVISALGFNGTLGNNIFFVCSAWFLLDKADNSKQKLFKMAADVWVISVIYLFATLILTKGEVPIKLIIRSLLPNIYSNNWYITYYILFCFAHPFLNKIIDGLSQQRLLRVSFCLLFLYYGIYFLFRSDLSFSNFVLWCAAYFSMAYLKKHMQWYCKSRKANLITLIIAILCNTALFLVTDLLGLHFSVFSDNLTHWCNMSNPFLLLISISLFNLLNSLHFKNKGINMISSLSLLIYIIHENILFREYFRPIIWHNIYSIFGHKYDFLWIMLFSAFVFVYALTLSFIYNRTLQRVTASISGRFFTYLSRFLSRLEKFACAFGDPVEKPNKTQFTK